MRKFLLIIPLLLFVPSRSSAVPTFVQQCSTSEIVAGSGFNPACTLTLGANHVMVVMLYTCGPNTTFGDSLALTYTGVPGATILGFPTGTCNFRNPTMNMYYACTGAGGSDTIHFTGDATGYDGTIIWAEFSATVCSPDGTGVTNSAAGTTGSQSGGNLTTSGTGDLIVSIITVRHSGSILTPSVGSGYTLVSTYTPSALDGGSTPMVIGMEYKVAGGAGSYATDWTVPVNDDWVIMGGAFGASAASLRHKPNLI